MEENGMTGSEETVFKPVFYGYAKEQVLARIDAILAIREALIQGQLTSSQAQAQAEQECETPLQKRFGGFQMQQVEDYLRRLCESLRYADAPDEGEQT